MWYEETNDLLNGIRMNLNDLKISYCNIAVVSEACRAVEFVRNAIRDRLAEFDVPQIINTRNEVGPILVNVGQVLRETAGSYIPALNLNVEAVESAYNAAINNPVNDADDDEWIKGGTTSSDDDDDYDHVNDN